MTSTATTADQPSATITTSAVSQANAPAPQDVPVVLSAAAAPPSAETDVLSDVLEWVGLSPLATDGPAAPVESPALLAMLAWARRQSGQSALTEAQTLSADPMQTSLALAATTASADELEAGTPIGVGRDPTGVAVSGDRIYVANQYDKTVSVIDATNGTVVATIPVGGSASALAVTPDGSRAYVTIKGSNRVAVINTATNTVTKTINVGPGPTAIAISPDGSRAYVSNTSGSTVSVINTTTNTAIARITVGSQPGGLTVSPDGSRVYVTSRLSDRISVINTATNTVVANIAVGDSPRDVAVTADGSRAYVANYDGTVSVIDTATNTAVGEIAVGNEATSVAVNSDGSLAFVANGDDTVSVIDTETNTVIQTLAGIDPTPEVGAHDIVVSPDGSTVYVTDFRDRVLRVLTGADVVGNHPPVETAPPTVNASDPATGKVTGAVHVEDQDVEDTLVYTVTGAPAKGKVTVNDDGTFEYTPTTSARLQADPGDVDTFTVSVTDGHGGTIDVEVTTPISPAAFVADRRVGGAFFGAPLGVAFSPDGTRAYITDTESNDLRVVDTATHRQIAAVDLDDLPGQEVDPVYVVVSPDGGRAYVYHSTGYVSVVDTEANALVDTLAAPIGHTFGRSRLALSPDGSRLYLTDFKSFGTVAVYDTTTNTLIDTAAGSQPSGVAVTPDGSRVYFANTDSDAVSVLDATTNEVIKTIPVGLTPFGLAISPDGTRVYVVNSVGTSMSVIDTSSDTVTATFEDVRGLSESVAVSPDGSLVYINIAIGSINGIQVIDAATLTEVATVNVGDGGSSLLELLAVSPDGSTIYVTDKNGGDVWVVTLQATAP
jgi:YVTN family beta-propeller protein/VCBS repeat-containing protein